MHTKVILLLVLIALLTLSACKSAKDRGPAALAYDFTRTGLVPGKTMPSGIQVKEDLRFSKYSSMAGETTYTGANLFININSDKLVTNAAIDAPGTGVGAKLPGAKDTDCVTHDGKSIFSLTKQELTEHYGKPSWVLIDNVPPMPSSEQLIYYYNLDPATLIMIRVSFETGANNTGKPDLIAASIGGLDIIADEAGDKVKIYKWPSDLRAGIRRPAVGG
jgi:hypothetical protein